MRGVLICPVCKNSLYESADGLHCPVCARDYGRDQDGYFSFILDEQDDPKQVPTESYCEHQKAFPVRVYQEFLKPLISSGGGRVLLDVGCGLGTEVLEARKEGYDAYGVDLPNMAPYWQKNGNSPSSFFACSAVRMPLRDSCFDFVWSLGVIEHIGTTSDTATLTADYRKARQDYVNELIRVTKPGGQIVVSCPNKSFPVDIHHGPTCGTHFKRLRWYVFNKTKLNFHKTWGKYHLLSYCEVNRLFLGNKFVDSVTPLPLTNYFEYNAFQSGYLRGVRFLVRTYVEKIPSILLPTFLNPYMLVMVRRKAQQGSQV